MGPAEAGLFLFRKLSIESLALSCLLVKSQNQAGHIQIEIHQALKLNKLHFQASKQ